MYITLVSCFYELKSKFDIVTYSEWIKHLIKDIKNFNLIIYTNEKSFTYIKDIVSIYSNIKIIFKEFNEFILYKYKDKWIKNQTRNIILSNNSCWELIMLWCEKVNFVNDAINNRYFDTEWYGWCDIGYFRDGCVSNWPNPVKISSLDKTKIYYTQICDDITLYHLNNRILNSTQNNLPYPPFPDNQVSVAGGFFLIYKDMIEKYTNIFNNRIELYFKHNYFIQHDQTIIIDCIILNKDMFHIIKQDWFGFREFLQ